MNAQEQRFTVLRASKLLHFKIAQEQDFLFRKTQVVIELGSNEGALIAIPGIIRRFTHLDDGRFSSAPLRSFAGLDISVNFKNKIGWWSSLAYDQAYEDYPGWETYGRKETEMLENSLQPTQGNDTRWPRTTVKVNVSDFHRCLHGIKYCFYSLLEGKDRTPRSYRYVTGLLKPFHSTCTTQPVQLHLQPLPFSRQHCTFE